MVIKNKRRKRRVRSKIERYRSNAQFTHAAKLGLATIKMTSS